MDKYIRTWQEDGQTYQSIIACDEKCLNAGIPACDCKPVMEVRKRLAAYEDTGLEPEEVAELAQAKQDGRLVVLPCKVGDEVFSFRWNVKAEKYEVVAGKVKDVSVRHDSRGNTVMISDGGRYGNIFGKTVFLTRAEAETALKEW